MNYYSRRRFNYTLAVCKLLQRIPEKYGIKNSLVKPAIDFNNFNFYQNKNFSTLSFKFGYIGRIVKEKGLRELISSLPILKVSYPNVNLVIAGDGKYLEKLKSLAKKSLVEKNMVLLGEIKESRKFYEIVDILVLPSYYEAMPLVLIEAMAAGTVVVTSNVGCISEIIIDGYNGILLKNISPESISESVFRLIENKELMIKYRNNGFETVKNFSITSMVNSFVECMRELQVVNELEEQ